MKRRGMLWLSSAAWIAANAGAWASDATIHVSRPTGNGFVMVTVTRPDGSVDSIPISVTTVMTAEEKRDQIAVNLLGRGYSTAPVGSDGVKIQNLDAGTSVRFDPGATGEEADRVTAIAADQGHVEFQGYFDPRDANGTPARFTAGFIAPTGSVLMQVSAEELEFATDGLNIAAHLYERLWPEAQRLSVGLTVDDAGLHMQFPSSARPRDCGVVFGTTSLTPGCQGHASSGTGGGGIDSADPILDMEVTAQPLGSLSSKIELTSNRAQEYCVYLIARSDCNRLQAGDWVCVNCPDGGRCPGTLGFAIVNGNNVECTGSWRSAGQSCDGCPAGGKTGWKFK